MSSSWKNNRNIQQEYALAIKCYLIKRDGIYCAICKKEITDIDDASPDHKVPVRYGGVHELSNFQIAHRKCNRLRGRKYYN